ncbi:MAG: AMP-binding protein, partial [bacterium]|nr:AMP-binding protein [bacterium]
MLKPIDEITLLTSTRFIQQKEYWMSKLEGAVDTTIPFNKKTEGENGDGTAKEPLDIPAGTTRSLMAVTKKSPLPIYIILMGALKTVIHHYTGETDIVVISPVLKNKVTEETLNNSVFIRDRLKDKGNMTFKELLLSTRQSTLEAYKHQDYPSEKLPALLSGNETGGHRRAISNILCRMTNIHDQSDDEDTHQRLIFSFQVEGEQVKGHIQYEPGIYDRFYCEQLARHFATVLEQVMENIDRDIPDIEFLSPREKEQLLYDFNDTATEYPTHKPVHEIFRDKVAQTPKNVAVTGPTKTGGTVEYTYAALNEKANRLASFLRTQQVGADTIVAIMAEPSVEMFVGLVAILKAGGAYLPLEPSYPVERVAYILKDSGTRFILTHGQRAFEGFNGAVIELNDSAAYTGDGTDLEAVT